MQGKSKFAQMLDHLDHVQYMINDRCSFLLLGVEYGTRCFVPFNILGYAKYIIQHLNDIRWLGLLENAAKFIIHYRQHYTSHRSTIRDPLLISFSGCTWCCQWWLFRCWIIYHINDPFMLQNYSEPSIPAIEVGTLEFVIVQQ